MSSQCSIGTDRHSHVPNCVSIWQVVQGDLTVGSQGNIGNIYTHTRRKAGAFIQVWEGAQPLSTCFTNIISLTSAMTHWNSSNGPTPTTLHMKTLELLKVEEHAQGQKGSLGRAEFKPRSVQKGSSGPFPCKALWIPPHTIWGHPSKAKVLFPLCTPHWGRAWGLLIELNTISVPSGLETKQGLLLPLTLGLQTLLLAPSNVWQIGWGSKLVSVPHPTALWMERSPGYSASCF